MYRCTRPECHGRTFATSQDRHEFLYHMRKFYVYRCPICRHEEATSDLAQGHFRMHRTSELRPEELAIMKKSIAGGYEHIGRCVYCVWRNSDAGAVLQHESLCRFAPSRVLSPEPLELPRIGMGRGRASVLTLLQATATVDGRPGYRAITGSSGLRPESSIAVVAPRVHLLAIESGDGSGAAQTRADPRPEAPEQELRAADVQFAMSQQMRDPDVRRIDHLVVLRGNLYLTNRRHGGRMFTTAYINGLLESGVYGVARRREETENVAWAYYVLHHSNPSAFRSPDSPRPVQTDVFCAVAEMSTFMREWMTVGLFHLSVELPDGRYWLSAGGRRWMLTLSDVGLFVD